MPDEAQHALDSKDGTPDPRLCSLDGPILVNPELQTLHPESASGLPPRVLQPFLWFRIQCSVVGSGLKLRIDELMVAG
jgi:hypothetical protein